MRRCGQARRRDVLEKPLLEAWRALGLICFQLSIPDGPDVLIVDPRAFNGPRHLSVEIKSGPKANVKRNQIDAGAGTYWPIVTSVEAGLALFGVRDE